MNPEIWPSKVSCATDLSPTTIFTLPALPLHAPVAMPGAVGGVPGVGMWVGTREGYTGYYPGPSQTPELVIF